MPRYDYRCTDCGDQLEVVQSFTDDPLTVCPACGGTLRKLFSSVGVVFKGSGFYRTDSRAAAETKADGTAGEKATAKTESTEKSTSSAEPATSKNETKKDSAPGKSASSTTATSAA